MPEMLKTSPELIAMRGDPPCGRWPGNSTIQTDTMAASGDDRD